MTFAIQDKTPHEGMVLSAQSLTWGGEACWILLTNIYYFVNLLYWVYRLLWFGVVVQLGSAIVGAAGFYGIKL